MAASLSSPPDQDSPTQLCSSSVRYDADILPRMLYYSGRLSSDLNPIMPFEFGGCDYALILHAALPNGPLDLRQLCWSDKPAASQLEENISTFCEAAHSSSLPDIPNSSLSVSKLLPIGANIVHHIAVQRWLYSLFQRYAADPQFDAATTRLELKQYQLTGVRDVHCAVADKDGASYVTLIAEETTKSEQLSQQLMSVKRFVVDCAATSGTVNFNEVLKRLTLPPSGCQPE